MLSILVWAGSRARYILALGCIAALFLPALSAMLRPVLPFLVSLVLALAMSRIDLGATARTALRPARLGQLLLICIALIPVTALLYWALAQILHLPDEMRTALVYLAAAPPIASAAGLCFLLGFNARLAVEVTVAATLLTPVLGPLTVSLFLPEAASLSPLLLARNLAGMIAFGVVLAIALRHFMTPARIAANTAALDGVNALTMLIFVIPLFDGVGALMLAHPAYAIGTLVLCFVVNIGANIATSRTLSRHLAPETAGAAGILQGNRTVAIYLAALPPDPAFTLFVALYQFPMYLTPLLLRRR